MDHYQRLGVARSSDFPTIQKAYHQLALKYHPDHNPKTGDLFAQINAAYEVLSDPKKRQAYDLTLSLPSSPVRPAPKPPKPHPVPNTYNTPLYRWPLEYVFHFNAEDLTFNRQGKLSPAQIQNMQHRYTEKILTETMVVGVILGICSLGLLAFMGSESPNTLAVVGSALFAVSLLITGFVTYWRINRNKPPNFESLPIFRYSGPLKIFKDGAVLTSPDLSLMWNVDEKRSQSIEMGKIYEVYYLDNPLEILSIELGQTQSKEQATRAKISYFQRLQAKFDFSESDLGLNRQGKISASQARQLTRQLQIESASMCGFVGFFAALAGSLVFVSTFSDAGMMFFPILFGALCASMASAWVYRVYGRNEAKLLQQADAVKRVNGFITLSPSGERGGGWTLKIANVDLKVEESQAKILFSHLHYTIYYSTYPKSILSLEVNVDQSKQQG